MKAFSAIAPYLSNPLVLMGFVLLLFFGIHRTLLKSGFIPRLSPSAGRRILERLLRYGFVIAVLIIVLGFATEIWKTQRTDQTATRETAKIVTGIEDISKSFALLQKQGGLISHPSTPQELYHNARLHELNGDYAAARQDYTAYLRFNLPFIDPHLSYQRMLKAQEGKNATREVYKAMLSKASSNIVLEFAGILLMEREERINHLKTLAATNPEFAPAYYQLSVEYSQASAGERTLAEKRLERTYLEKFLELDSRGAFIKYFLDKTLAATYQEDAATRLTESGSVLPKTPDAPVRLSGMLSNDGWTINILIAEEAKEIFYRFPTDAVFKSTGVSPVTDPRTGLRRANQYITAGNIKGKYLLSIKYLDLKGRENGPYQIMFDTEEELAKEVKDIMNTTANWVSFRYFDGRLLVYFTHILSYKNAIKDIRYSVDDESLARRYPFKPWPGAGTPEVGRDEQTYIEVPLGTRYLYVQLVYIDGTGSEKRKILNVASK